MFTLLPQQQKKKLWKLYRIRLAIIFLLFVTTMSLVSIGFLFPSYISLAFNKDALNIDTKNLESKIAEKNNKGLNETLDQIKITLLSVNPDETNILESIRIILDRMPHDISVQSLNYTRGQDAPSSIVVNGVAGDRNSLIIFTKQLQSELMFDSVNLPVSNLAKQSETPFSLTILGKF